MNKEEILKIYEKRKKIGDCTLKMLTNAVAFDKNLSTDEAEIQIRKLMADGDLVLEPITQTLKTPAEMGLKQGVLSKNPKGFGFVSIAGQAEDVFVPSVFMGKAIYGDRVLVEIVKDKFNPDKECGIIRAITGHSTKNIAQSKKLVKKSCLFPTKQIDTQ